MHAPENRIRKLNKTVIPAKAGIQGCKQKPVFCGPGFPLSRE